MTPTDKITAASYLAAAKTGDLPRTQIRRNKNQKLEVIVSMELLSALRRNNRLWGLIDELRRENNKLSRKLQELMGLNGHAEVMMALDRIPECLPESIDLGNPPDADESNVEEPSDENV